MEGFFTRAHRENFILSCVRFFPHECEIELKSRETRGEFLWWWCGVCRARENAYILHIYTYKSAGLIHTATRVLFGRPKGWARVAPQASFILRLYERAGALFLFVTSASLERNYLSLSLSSRAYYIHFSFDARRPTHTHLNPSLFRILINSGRAALVLSLSLSGPAPAGAKTDYISLSCFPSFGTLYAVCTRIYELSPPVKVYKEGKTPQASFSSSCLHRLSFRSLRLFIFTPYPHPFTELYLLFVSWMSSRN